MYISVKRIGKNKTPYAYLQHSVRVGKRVRTRSRYLGPLRAMNFAVQAAGKIHVSKEIRDALTKSFPEMLAEKDARVALREAAENAPVFIGDLKVGEFKQETFDNEAMSQKCATVSDASPSSSDGGEQYSSQTEAEGSDQGSENPGE